MGRTIAMITVSVDGYVTGPDDRPGQGLGIGGERLHNWVMGGPWSYSEQPSFGMSGADKEFYDGLVADVGASVCGRGMYTAAGAWGGRNPFDWPLFVVTHQVEDPPDAATGFRFVVGVAEALARAREAAGGRDVAVAGGADVIRQALGDGHLDVLALSTAPVVLGGGKRLFDGFTTSLDLEILSVHPSRFATHTTYAVR